MKGLKRRISKMATGIAGLTLAALIGSGAGFGASGVNVMATDDVEVTDESVQSSDIVDNEAQSNETVNNECDDCKQTVNDAAQDVTHEGLETPENALTKEEETNSEPKETFSVEENETPSGTVKQEAEETQPARRSGVGAVLMPDSVAAPTGDIKSVTFDKTSAKPEDTIKLTITPYSGKLNGADSLSIVLKNADSTKYLYGQKNSDGTFTASEYVDYEWENGEYKIEEISYYDDELYTRETVDCSGIVLPVVKISGSAESPIIRSLKFDKQSYSAGDTIKVSLEAEDASGLRDAWIEVVNETNGNYFSRTIFPIKYSENMFQGEIKTNDSWKNGEYSVDSIFIQDTLYHFWYSNRGERHIPSSARASFTLNNSPENYNNLKIKSVKLDKSVVSPGDILKIIVEPMAGKPDISKIKVHIAEKNTDDDDFVLEDYSTDTMIIVPDENGSFTKSIPINNGFKNGAYKIKGIIAYGDDGRYYYYKGADSLLDNAEFTVTNSKGEESAPRIKYVKYDKDIYMPEETVIISAELVDGGNKADYIDIGLGGVSEGMGGGNKLFGEVRLFPDKNGVYKGEYKLPDRQTIGVWTDMWHLLRATVNAGNDVRNYVFYQRWQGDNAVDFKTDYFSIDTSTVSNAVREIKLSDNLLVLNKGGNKKLTYVVQPDTATDKTVTWSSSNTGVATVDNTGNVTAVNHGTAKITAKTSNGKTAECEVRVNFADVASTSQYYYKPVYWAAENKITTGSNGLFDPHNSCTREHAITFLWRMAGSPQPKSMVSKFKDIQNKNSYSYKAIMWGTEKGIITGSGGVFAPNNTCTREQIVTMLWRLAGKPAPKITSSKFKDVQNKNSYSYNAILWASEKGITTGANGEFKPGKTCTRAEIVTFIYRYKNTVK